MIGPFNAGVYWHRFGGWTIIVKAGIREYRAARPDGLWTKLKLWGHVVYSAEKSSIFGVPVWKPQFPGRPGLRLSRCAWKDYAPWKPDGLEVRL